MSKLVNLSHLKKVLNRIKTYVNNKVTNSIIEYHENNGPDWLINIKNRTHYLEDCVGVLRSQEDYVRLSTDLTIYVVVDDGHDVTKIDLKSVNGYKTVKLPSPKGPIIVLQIMWVESNKVAKINFITEDPSIQQPVYIYANVKPLLDIYIPDTIARVEDANPMIELRYSNLKTLRDNNELIPGKQYCIKDYQTTTSQTGTKSEDKVFDVIVTADSTNTLNEEARVRKPLSRSTIKIIKSNSSITPLICRLTDGILGIKTSGDYTLYYRIEVISGEDSELSSYDLLSTTPNPSANDEIFKVAKNSGTVSKYGNVSEVIDYFEGQNLEAWKIWYCLDNDTTKFGWADTTNGKGVIYRMIDEYNNDCPYDFKNIKFKRTTVTVEDPDILNSLGGMYVGYTGDTLPAELQNTDSEVYYYTFQHSDGETDLSITNNKNNKKSVCTGNVIKESFRGMSDMPLRYLNNIVLFSDKGVYRNTFDGDCFSMSIYSKNDEVWENHFGQYCRQNIIVSDVPMYQNSIKDNMCMNLIGTCNNSFYFIHNVIDSYFQHNTIISDFSHNYILIRFNHNTILEQFLYNNIETYFEYNNINALFKQNRIGNAFRNNVITSDGGFEDNDIGNHFNNNTILSTRPSNPNKCFYRNTVQTAVSNNIFDCVSDCTILDTFSNNTLFHVLYCKFGTYIMYNTFGIKESENTKANLRFCNFGNRLLYNSFNYELDSGNGYAQYINVQSGVMGTEDSPNIIDLPTVDTEVQVAKNSKGEIKIYTPADLVE